MGLICRMVDGPAAGKEVNYEAGVIPKSISVQYPQASLIRRASHPGAKTILYHYIGVGRDPNTYLFSCHLEIQSR